MSTPPTKPSGKGYTPVPPMPLAEQIDDGVEQPQTDAEAAGEDNDLYRSSPPLLSSRSRGNETPLRVGNNNWFERLRSWRPFTPDNRYASFNASSKTRNWRKITLWTLFGTLVAAVVALGISTGVLANQLRSARRRSYYSYPRRSYQNSHLPFNDKWQSSNNRLNFVRVYPSLDSSSSLSCQAAWRTLQYVPCHEKIWNRSWDNGTTPSLFDPDIAVYTTSICTYSCEASIGNAYLLIASACSDNDKFDMSDYIGPFSVDPGLEASPIGVITTLASRLQHMCRKDIVRNTRRYYGWEQPYCTANIWEDWRIIDGMNAGNLNGLDMFEKQTSFARTINYRQQRRNYVEDTCDDAYYSSVYRDGERKLGPTANSTTCDYCTMNWFERKLMGWEKDQIKDPKSGEVVGLQDYLKKIRSVGVRCDADAWDRVWDKAVRKYKQSGDLPKDWEGDDGKHGKKPCDCTDARGKDKPCAKKAAAKKKEYEKLPYVEIDAVPAGDAAVIIID